MAYVRKRADGVPLPAEWMLEVTNRCNLACPMCLRDKADFVTADMREEFFQHLLATNPAPDALWPYGYGEPLMYGPLFAVIRHARSRNVVTSVSTNGTRLSRDVAHALLESGLDYLIIAFDGATPETYSRYRKGANFHEVKGNVQRFLDLKVARRSKLHVTIQMIRMEGTADEAGAFRQLWNRPGVDRIRIREDLSKKHDGVNGLNETASPRRHRPCFFLWRGPLFIQAAGTVIPCPYYHGATPVADLKEQTVDQAWNSPDMIELRRAHVMGDLSKFPICGRCPRYQPHPVLAGASFLIGTPGIRRYMPLLERLQDKLGRKFFE
jgi:MoaA/NifB/PqqE/SkfB family radical SAM enzyme